MSKVALQRLTFVIGRLASSTLYAWFRESSDSQFVRLGTEYGGWICAANGLESGGYALCVGAGEDVSFDIALISTFGVNVLCVDPTPRSIAHVENLLSGVSAYDLRGFEPGKFQFLPVALWNEDGTIRLYAPADPSHVSHSALNLQKTTRFIEARCVRLTTLMQQHGIDELHLLKLDIEGAECAVLEDLLSTAVRPAQLLIEFDALYTLQVAQLWRVVQCIRRLRSAGYRLARAQGANFTFEYGRPAAAAVH